MYNSRMSFGLRKRYWPPAPVTGDPARAQVPPRWDAVLMAAGSHRLRVPSASGRGPILEVSAFTNILDSHEESPAISAFTNAQAPQGLIPRNLNSYQCHRGGGRYRGNLSSYHCVPSRVGVRSLEISAFIIVLPKESRTRQSRRKILSVYHRFTEPVPKGRAASFSAFINVLRHAKPRNPLTVWEPPQRQSGSADQTAPAPESGSLQLATFNHPTNLQPTGALCLPPDIT